MCPTGSFQCNSAVNENCNVIILPDNVKASVMQSNEGLNEEAVLLMLLCAGIQINLQ